MKKGWGSRKTVLKDKTTASTFKLHLKSIPFSCYDSGLVDRQQMFKRTLKNSCSRERKPGRIFVWSVQKVRRSTFMNQHWKGHFVLKHGFGLQLHAMAIRNCCQFGDIMKVKQIPWRQKPKLHLWNVQLPCQLCRFLMHAVRVAAKCLEEIFCRTLAYYWWSLPFCNQQICGVYCQFSFLWQNQNLMQKELRNKCFMDFIAKIANNTLSQKALYTLNYTWITGNEIFIHVFKCPKRLPSSS